MDLTEEHIDIMDSLRTGEWIPDFSTGTPSEWEEAIQTMIVCGLIRIPASLGAIRDEGDAACSIQ